MWRKRHQYKFKNENFLYVYKYIIGNIHKTGEKQEIVMCIKNIYEDKVSNDNGYKYNILSLVVYTTRSNCG